MTASDACDHNSTIARMPLHDCQIFESEEYPLPLNLAKIRKAHLDCGGGSPDLVNVYT